MNATGNVTALCFDNIPSIPERKASTKKLVDLMLIPSYKYDILPLAYKYTAST
jgi:hypothetical protein